MYEVGPWFLLLMDLAILAVIGIIVVIAILVKRGKNQRDAELGIQCEILLSTGWAEYHTVRCEANDKWVVIGGFQYKLDPNKSRWGLHPRVPFMGLRTLQAPIRKCTWEKDNPDAVFRDAKTPVVTSAEIKAMLTESAAMSAGAEAIELAARQSQMVKAIANQPNKTYVYVGLGVIILTLIILLVRSFIGVPV